MQQDYSLDRRKRQRFSMSMQATYCLLETGGDNKFATVCDMSSQGLLMESAEPLPCGKNIVVSVLWPVMLPDCVGLRCMVRGRVVRSELQNNVCKSAVQFRFYEFRTYATLALAI
jgi:hypothetical protein